MRRPVLQEHLLTPLTAHGAVWRYSPEHPKLPHFHGQLEFLVVKRGTAIERVGGGVHRVAERQLIWHLPGLAHELVGASSDLDLRVVHVEPDLMGRRDTLGEYHGDRREDDRSTAGGHCFAGWVRVLSRFAAGRPVVELTQGDLDAILEGCDSTSDRASGIRDATRSVQVALRGAWRATRTHHDDLRANSLVELASCRLLEDPFLERSRLCRELCVSAGYLSRRFRAELGVTFREQRARARLIHFMVRAARTRCNWLDAALDSGFGSYSQLHRVFAERVGMSPRAYLSQGGRNRRALVPA